MIKFTVETTSKNLTELLTDQQLEELKVAKRNTDYQFIIQVVGSQNIGIAIGMTATLDSYILYSGNEKEDTYPDLKGINLISDGANNTDVRIITT